MECSVCKEKMGLNGLRFGVCWDCATKESIIADGTDMYGKGPNGGEPAKTPMDKLKFILAEKRLG